MSRLDTLRIAWASPWNETSAIAAFGLEVTHELRTLGHEVEIIRTETGTAAALPSHPAWSGSVHPAAGLSREDLLAFDAIVANFGNHFPFHGGLIGLLSKLSAHVSIMHDAWMGDFVHGWRHAAAPNRDGVDDWLAAFEPDLSALSSFCALGDSVVIHSEHYRAGCARTAPGRVVKLPLAYTTPPVPDWSGPGRTLTLATIGHANPNKQIGEVIKAIGASRRLRNRVHYRVIGPVAPNQEQELLSLAERTGAPRPLFTGYVPDETLRELLDASDVLCCLRYPLTEGGSASAVVGLLSARPMIVSDHGSYGELPDDVVLKCRPGAEAAQVAHYLERILDAPDAAIAMGKRARAYALRVHHPKAYARGLLDLLAHTIPVSPLLRAARSVGRSLGEFGMNRNDPEIARVAGVLAMGAKADG